MLPPQTGDLGKVSSIGRKANLPTAIASGLAFPGEADSPGAVTGCTPVTAWGPAHSLDTRADTLPCLPAHRQEGNEGGLGFGRYRQGL